LPAQAKRPVAGILNDDAERDGSARLRHPDFQSQALDRPERACRDRQEKQYPAFHPRLADARREWTSAPEMRKSFMTQLS
jgi:hypothetical protein